MRKILLLFLLLTSFTIHAENEKPIGLTDLENEPSIMIAGCVNAITGNFTHHCKTMVVPGCQPVVMEHFYVSGPDQGLFFNHTTSLEMYEVEHARRNPDRYINLHDTFEGSYEFIEEGRFKAYMGDKLRNYCNTSKGMISAKTNPRNIKVWYAGKYWNEGSGLPRHCVIVKNPAGERLEYFQRYRFGAGPEVPKNQLPPEELGEYELRRKRFMNGNSLFFTASETHKGANETRQDYKEQHIYSVNKANNETGWIRRKLHQFRKASKPYKWKSYDKFQKMCECYSMDGRKVTYTWEKTEDGAEIHFDPIEGLETTYKLGDREDLQLIKKIEWPDSRFMAIRYYSLAEMPQKEDSKHHYYYGYRSMKRVKELRGLTPYGTTITNHRFEYEFDLGNRYNITKGHTIDSAGTTLVFDAVNHKKSYRFDVDKRLKEVIHYTGTGPWSIYSLEKLYWGTGNNQGHLLSRTFHGSCGEVLFLRYYKYDDRGNPWCIGIAGNLTGQNKAPACLDGDCSLFVNGCDHYQKLYKYDQDNLMTYENDVAMGREVAYFYHKGTDLLASKLTISQGKIQMREFFEYDENGCVKEEIIDDGCNWDKNCLVGVTERRIKRTKSRTEAPFCLPQVVKEYYVENGEEKLLHKTVSKHNPFGWLYHEDHFDSNGNFAYFLAWDHDVKGRVTANVNALGQETRRQYDASGNVIREQSPDNNFVTLFDNTYTNQLGQKTIQCTDGQAFCNKTIYNDLCWKTAEVDIYGNQTLFSHDDFGRCIKVVLPPVAMQDGSLAAPVIAREYDTMGNVASETNPLGHTTKTSYNLYGKPTFISHPDGTTDSFTYSVAGMLLESVDRNGCLTKIDYDYQGRPTRTEIYSAEGALLTSTTKEYNAFHLLKETDNAGHITCYSYDPAGRLISKRKGSSRADYLYDSLGRQCQVREFFGEGEEDYIAHIKEYDALGRAVLEKVQDSSGNVSGCTQYSYDEAGRVIQIITDGRAVTTTTYNAIGDVTSVTDPLGRTIHYHIDYKHVDKHGCSVKLLEATDPQGNMTRTVHNTHGKPALTERFDPFGNKVQKFENFYDLCGNLVGRLETVITPGGSDREIRTGWEYDCMNRVVGITEAIGTPEQKTTRTEYNKLGQKSKDIKPDGTSIAYTYDSMGRMKTMQGIDVDYSYEYDANSNPIRIADQINGVANTLSYDNNDRCIEETLGNGLTVRYKLDCLGRPIQVLLPDESSVAYAYKGVYLADVTRTKGDACYKNSYAYQFGKVDSEEKPGACGPVRYERDLLGRPTSIESNQWKSNLEYDLLGNILTRKVSDPLGSQEYRYRYDALNQLIEEKGDREETFICDSLYNRVNKNGKACQINALNQLISYDGREYQYDLCGNLVAADGVRYHYDALNRLSSVEKEGRTIRYLYDDKSRRLGKIVEGSPGETVYFLYIGQNEVGSLDAGKNFREFRVLGVGLGAEIGGSIAFELEGKTYVPLHDHNGNVSCLQDLQGNVVETYRYTAFGEETAGNQAVSPWRFSSKRTDPETGFVYFGRRYYDAETGRWTTQDPLGFDAGPNLYAYVSNNPLTHFDLYGLREDPPSMYENAREQRNSYRQFNRDGSGSSHKDESRRSLLDTAKAASRFVTEGIGAIIYALGEHLIPIPYGRKLLSKLGHVISGGTKENFVSNTESPAAHWDWVGGDNLAPNLRIYYINGMNCSYEDMLKQVMRISDCLGGARVYYCYNPAQGTLFNCFQSFMQHLGIKTPAYNACKALNDYLIKDSGGPGVGSVVSLSFSQGGLIVNSVMKSLSTEDKKMMEYHTYGSAAYIDRECGAKQVTNTVLTGDGVSIVANLLGMLFGTGWSFRNANFVKSDGYLFDHRFDHPLYMESIQLLADNLKQHYGK